ncbi:MAG TPA: L,D-transpeptidase family protein [Solirubrobacteraceae bacterium]|jgi:peptidoglycan hydrolase-like protein with peptidoglycan-binding domain|nr:L,D-transpeptidase family protein [Solirubrobacteraceae bacterium]
MRIRTVLVRLALVAAVAAVILCSGVAARIGGLRATSNGAVDATGSLPATRLTALPPRTISDGTAALRVRFSGHLASFSPRPHLSPAVAGRWVTHGDSDIFRPTTTLEPCSTYRLGISAATSTVLHSPIGVHRDIYLHVACPSVRGLQLALARLDYLPYHANTASLPRDPGASRTRLTAIAAFRPPRSEDMHARYSGAPSLNYGELDETTKGALMVFQSEHELEATGEADEATWRALFGAVEHDQRKRSPYTWVTVSQSIPETLEVHQGSHVALSSPTNTGVPGAETAQGTFPIFSRFTSTTMTGTNPDGSKYSDPGVPWVNYFNGGDAVHGFPRGSYGTPQSDGCVELPIETAQTVFGMLAIGDIVVVG